MRQFSRFFAPSALIGDAAPVAPTGALAPTAPGGPIGDSAPSSVSAPTAPIAPSAPTEHNAPSGVVAPAAPVMLVSLESVELLDEKNNGGEMKGRTRAVVLLAKKQRRSERPRGKRAVR